MVQNPTESEHQHSGRDWYPSIPGTSTELKAPFVNVVLEPVGKQVNGGYTVEGQKVPRAMTRSQLGVSKRLLTALVGDLDILS